MPKITSEPAVRPIVDLAACASRDNADGLILRNDWSKTGPSINDPVWSKESEDPKTVENPVGLVPT